MSRISTLLAIHQRIARISANYGSNPVGHKFDEACKNEFSVKNGLEFHNDYFNLIKEIRNDIEIIPNLSDRHKAFYNSTIDQVANVFSSTNMLKPWNQLSEILLSQNINNALIAMEPLFEIERSALSSYADKNDLIQEITNIRVVIEELEFLPFIKKMLLMHIAVLTGLLDNLESFKESEIKVQYESFVAKFCAAYFDLSEVDRKKAKPYFENMIKRVRDVIGLANDAKKLADNTGVTQVLTEVLSR